MAKVRDRHGRFSKLEVEQILSPANRHECREKLGREPHIDDMIEHWLDKNVVQPCISSRKESDPNLVLKSTVVMSHE